MEKMKVDVQISPQTYLKKSTALESVPSTSTAPECAKKDNLTSPQKPSLLLYFPT
jgi:hypothetical protein